MAEKRKSARSWRKRLKTLPKTEPVVNVRGTLRRTLAQVQEPPGRSCATCGHDHSASDNPCPNLFECVINVRPSKMFRHWIKKIK